MARSEVDRTPALPRVSPRAALLERLRTIAADEQPEDALQPALQAIVDDFRATAAALCSFDSRHGLLRLLSEVGLSDEGCKRLRTIRASDPSAWEMPLHGVINRRAYLIEKAGENRYVPPLLDGTLPLRTIACLPLYDGSAPVGSLILIAAGSRNFGEADINQLAAPAQLVTAMIESLRRARGQQGPEVVSAPVTPRIDVAAVIAERDTLRSEVEARVAERARLAVQVAAGQQEISRLRGVLANAEAAVAGLTIEQARVQQDLARVPELTAALTVLERECRDEAAARAAAEQALAEHAQRTVTTTSEAAALQARLHALHDELASHQAAAAARERLAQERFTALEADRTDARALITARAVEVETLEDALRTAHRQHDELATRLATAAAQSTHTTSDAVAQAATARAEAEGSAAARDEAEEHLRASSAAHAAEREQLTGELTAVRAALAQSEASARAQTEAIASLQRHATETDAQLVAASRDAEQLRAALATAATRETHLREEIVRRESQRVATDQADVQTALDAARAAEAACEEARAAAATTAAELATVRAEQRAQHHAHATAVAELERLQLALAGAQREASGATEAHGLAVTITSERARAAAATIERQQGELRQLAQTIADRDAQVAAQTTASAAAIQQIALLTTELTALHVAVDETAARDATRRVVDDERANAQAKAERQLADRDAALTTAAATQTTLEAQRTAHVAREQQLEAQVRDLKAATDATRAELAAAVAAVVAQRAADDRRTRALEADFTQRLGALERTLEQQAIAAAAATATIERLRESLTTEGAGRAALATQLGAAEATIDGLASARDRAQADAAERATELARLLEERTALADECERLRTVAILPAEVTVGAPPPVAVAEDAPVRSVPRPTLVRPRAPVIELPTAAVLAAVVIIDVADRWGDVIDDRSVRRMAPDAVSQDACGPDDAHRIIVNLGAPGALAAIQALRAAGVTTPIWGCLVGSDGERGLALGPVECLDPPLDADAAIEALGPAANREGRVITAGADVDALISIRQALSRRQASVSMAWDAKQVIDLLAVAQPHALLADLDLPRGDGFAIVAAVAAAKRPPRLVLVGGGAGAHVALAALAIDNGLPPGLQPLPALVSDLVARTEASPIERRSGQRLRLTK